MKNLTQLSALLLFSVLQSQSSLSAQQVQVSESETFDGRLHLSQEAKVFVETELYDQGSENFSVSVFPIDERVKINACNSGYQFNFANQAAVQTYSTVKVTCAENDWFLFLNVKVEELKQVVITAETMSPGTLLTIQNLSVADINTQKLRHTTFTDVEELVGARLKYRVRHGQAITPNMVCFVCKGDVITLAAEAQGLSISTKGIAQQDGNRGDTIKVKNSRSEKVVLARVKDHSTAIVSI